MSRYSYVESFSAHSNRPHNGGVKTLSRKRCWPHRGPRRGADCRCRQAHHDAAAGPLRATPRASITVDVPAFHLAEVNIAIPVEPLGSERLADFMDQLAPVNAVADASPGFVWRMQDDSGNNTDIRGFGDERVIVNMSVWESLDALRAFVYSSRAHLDVLRRRSEWFERLSLYLALWWVPAGHRPSVDEAEERLTRLERLGPTREAFTFRVSFPPPDAADNDAVSDDRDLCPA
jgi:hypothetical protein